MSKYEHVFAGSKRAMVWLDERPVVGSPPSFLERRTKASPEAGGKSFYAAIELNLPSGPMVQYALLGGRYCADRSGSLSVKFSSIGDTRLRFCSQIATERDVIFQGIPEEYLHSIRKGIEGLDEGLSGNIEIDFGAHSIYGSSQSIFGRLALMFAKIFLFWPEDNVGRFLDNNINIKPS